MTHNFEILKKKVFELLHNELAEVYYYHNIQHTETMLEVASSYISHEGINPADSELLMVAILFHDLGFIDSSKSHEKKGAKLASEYMSELGYTAHEIQTVENLILATKTPQKPTTLLEKIMCDIDLDYLGRSDYEEISEQLYKEWLTLGVIENRSEWKKKELDFLENHRFHTSFGLTHRQPALNERIALLQANKEH